MSEVEAPEQWPPTRVWLPHGTAELAAVSPELQNVEGAWWIREDTLSQPNQQAAEQDQGTEDICDRCGKDFGLSGKDENGFNSTCVHCGNNTYTSQDQDQGKAETDEARLRLSLKAELRNYLNSMVITSDNIGEIRRSCFVPWQSRWNGIVRDETATREQPSTSDVFENPERGTIARDDPKSVDSAALAREIAEFDGDDNQTCGDCESWYCEHWTSGVAAIISKHLSRGE